MDELIYSAAVGYFYGTIRDMVSGIVGNIGLGISEDMLLLAIGYWKRHTWWGKALMIAAATMLGSTGGGLLSGLFRPTAKASPEHYV